jgi:hypothetical protein
VFCSLDEETKLRQSYHDQLAVSTTANAASQRELDDLRQALKSSEEKGLHLQADLTKSLDANSILQADVASSRTKIDELESEMRNLRAAVEEKLPLADRVLQLEKDIKTSAMSLQDAKIAYDEVLIKVENLTSEKMLLAQTLLSVQAENEERFNRTFKTKEEYILQVEAARSELEQTKQQLLQLQFTCNDMSSRIEESKRNEPQKAIALQGVARALVWHFLPACVFS